MPLSHIVNNVGVGLVECTMINLTTTVAAKQARPFTQALIDLYHRACSLCGNNEVGQGTTTAALFGAVLACSEQTTAKGFPQRLTVLSHGFAVLHGTTGNIAPSVISHHIPLQRAAFVACGTTTPATIASLNSRGVITEVFDGDTCVVCF